MNVASRVQRVNRRGIGRGRCMYELALDDLARIAEIFGVTAENVKAITHPLNTAYPAAAVTFYRGGNVAAALSSYLNHEFYKVGADLADEFIYREANLYSYVGEAGAGVALFLTITEEPKHFIRRLGEHKQEIRFVALHPQILFMMRPRMTYDAAKSCLKGGYELVL